MLYFKNKCHTITVRLNEKDYFILKNYSDRYKVTISSLIRNMIKCSWLDYEHM